jgi:hypothetical protein
MSVSPEIFKEKIESFLIEVSIPRKSDEEIQAQVEDTIILIAKELKGSSGDILSTNLMIFFRIIWGNIIRYLVHKYEQGSILPIMNNSNGFTLDNLQQEIQMNQEE